MADPRINIRVGTSGVSTTQRTLQGLMMNVRSWALGVGGALAAAFGTREIVRNLQSAVTQFDKLSKTAEKLGVATDDLSALHYAANILNIETGKMDTAFQRLTRRLAEAAKGTGEARGAIAELGLSAEDMVQLGLEDKVLALADAFSRVENPADRVRLAFKLFDTEGVELVRLLNLGEDGLRKLREEAEKLGVVVSSKTARGAAEFNDRLTRLRRTGTGLWWQLAGQILPALNRLAESLVVLTDASGPLRELWLGIGSLIGSAVDELAAFGAGMANVTASARAFLTTLKDTRSFSQAAWAAQTAGMAAQMTTLWRGSTTAIGRAGGGGGDAAVEAAALEDRAAAMAKYFGFRAKTAQTEQEASTMLGLQLNQLRELTELRQLEWLQAQQLSTDAEGRVLLTSEYLKAQQAYVQARQQELDLARQIDDMERSRAARQHLGTFGGQLGLQSAAMFQQLGTAAANAANIVTSTLGTAFEAISQQIQGLIRGTVSWAQALANIGTSVLTNLLASIVNFFVSMAARALLSALFGAAITKAAASAAAAAWAGPAILANTATYGAAGAVGLGATMASMSGAPLVTAAAIGGSGAGFAEGGLIPAGERLIRVNEEGPEFVVNAQATRRFLPDLEAMNAGGGSSGGGKVAVFIVDSTRDIRKRLEEDPSFSDVIVRTIRNRRTDVGIS